MGVPGSTHGAHLRRSGEGSSVAFGSHGRLPATSLQNVAPDHGEVYSSVRPEKECPNYRNTNH